MSICLTSWAGPGEDGGGTAVHEIWMDSRRVDVKVPISPPAGWLLVFNLKLEGWKIDETMLMYDF